MIDTPAALRALYAAPGERAVRKQIDHLDPHCRRFIALSPFLVLATSDSEHRLDASPRGGDPGFVKVSGERELLIPDAPGNNRLDSFDNILATGSVGLLFFIPGFDETLRVNGRARLSCDPAHVAACTSERRAPKLVVQVRVEAAYLHCAKAFMRSKLWDPASLVDRESMPTIGQMIADQSGMTTAPETRAEMVRRYTPDL
ncbi:pyridoxamine 5'-phosphate oxidase family protein [Aquabacterium humicola]|uniref:pyridoxamine 5'-phosphate oxidase family protein n=1 Tax=Aquabacterium humicola TaxID=3237377 RepID=UPI003F753946